MSKDDEIEVLEGETFDALEIDMKNISSPTLQRLIEEVRRDKLESYYTDEHGNLITDAPAYLYNRMHNRHNRSMGGGYNRMHNRHNRSR